MAISDECILREKARELIQAGTLPNRRPDRTWGGPGSGAHCCICSAPVGRDEVEFEIEFDRNGDAPGPSNYHVHLRCFAAWEAERGTLGPANGAMFSSDPASTAGGGTVGS